MEVESPFATKRQIVWLFVLFMCGVGMLAFLSQVAQDRQDILIQRQAAVILVQDRVTADLIQQSHASCLARNAASVSHNNLVDVLEQGVRDSTVMLPDTKVKRVALYEATKIAALNCNP